jgi:hypothetical protein
MKLIDPDGLFEGDRFKDVSDEARLFWPHFWCASNGYGRIELNPAKIIGRAFSGFRTPPTIDKFWSLIGEYQTAFLLFVYESSGQFWGQWATSEKFLPRHKRSEDEASPKPDSSELNAWREAYIEQKRAKSNAINIRENVAEILQKRRRENTAPFLPVERSVVECCIEERSRGTDNARASDPRPPIAADLDGQASQRFDEFWSLYPRKQGKDTACRLWVSFVTTANENAVFECLTRYLASDEVSRGIISNPDRWINSQHRDGWSGDWPAKSGASRNGVHTNIPAKKDFVSDVTEVMQRRVARGESPL